MTAHLDSKNTGARSAPGPIPENRRGNLSVKGSGIGSLVKRKPAGIERHGRQIGHVPPGPDTCRTSGSIGTGVDSVVGWARWFRAGIGCGGALLLSLR